MQTSSVSVIVYKLHHCMYV